MSGERVRIRYRRPPDREETYEQRLVAREAGVVVTLHEGATIARALVVDGAIALEPGSPVVWLSFANEWHDIGCFHRADGSFTGFYANVLTPVEGLDGNEWRTTDLFLDVWVPVAGEPRVLDEDELDDALRRGWVSEADAARATAEAARLVDAARAGTWPSAPLRRWTLERARVLTGTSARSRG